MRSPLAVLALALLLAAPSLATAQRGSSETPATAAAGRPLAPFAAMRVAVTPIQFWQPDSIGWSTDVAWATFRLQVDSALANALRTRGLGNRWAYGPDVTRSARRNPSLESNPSALGAFRWRLTPPQAGEALPAPLADNLRVVSALGDTRYALVPVELRIAGDSGVLRLVLVDTRLRNVVWTGDLGTATRDHLLTLLGERFADLIIEP